jgi:hypothetical protein
MLNLKNLRSKLSQHLSQLLLLRQPQAYLDQAIILLQQLRVWAFHARWQDQATILSHLHKVWLVQPVQVNDLLGNVQLAPAVIVADQELDLKEQVVHVQVVLVETGQVRQQLQELFRLQVDLVLEAEVAVVLQRVLLVKVDRKVLLKLESLSVLSVKNSNREWHLA